MSDPQHVTLVANTVSTINLASRARKVVVVNVDGAAAVYITVDGNTPTVAGNGAWVLPAAIGTIEIGQVPGPNPTVVKLISAGTPKVSVGVAA